MNTSKPFSFVFLLVAALGAGRIHAQEPPLPAAESLTAHVRFTGKTIAVNLPVDFSHRFKTELGTFQLPLRALKSLRLADDEASAVLTGTLGSRWLVQDADALVSRMLDQRDPLLVPFSEDLGTQRLKEVSFVYQGLSPLPGEGVKFMLIQTPSGQLIQAERLQNSLTLDTAAGRQDIPMERVNRVEFSVRVDAPQPVARVHWLNGFSLEGEVVDRQFKFRDRFGNKISCRPNEVSRLYLGPVVKEAPKALTAPHAVRVLFSDGREQPLQLQPQVLLIKTDRGLLSLASSEILEWEQLADRKDVVLCLTDGSIVIGVLQNDRLQFAAPSLLEEDQSYRPREISRMAFEDNRLMELGSGLYWSLNSSEVIRCDLQAASYRLLYQDGPRISEFEIPSSDIQSIVLTNYPSITISTDKRRYTLTPEVRGVDVLMPHYQNAFSLNWADVQQVVRQQVVTPSLAVWRTHLGLEGVTENVMAVREILIPAGRFNMGADRQVGLDDEGPVHPVELDSYYMDQTEVTVQQFRSFIEDSGYRSTAEQQRLPESWSSPGFSQEDDYPVTWMSWFDAVEFCNWRSKQANLEPSYVWNKEARRYECQAQLGGYRLPTEAEWEYAARSAGKDKRYPWGSESGLEAAVQKANFQQHRTEPYDNWFWTNPVDHFEANELGLFGMAGNVWEWCEDWYHPDAYYLVHRAMPRNPLVSYGDAPNLEKRVIRGGSFSNRLDFLRTTSRGSGVPGAVANRVGFRCVRSLPQPLP